jgi:hypothetical protein
MTMTPADNLDGDAHLKRSWSRKRNHIITYNPQGILKEEAPQLAMDGSEREEIGWCEVLTFSCGSCCPSPTEAPPRRGVHHNVY